MLLSRRGMLIAGILFLSVSCYASDTPKTVSLTILHTNDTHGHLLPYSYPSGSDPTSETAHLSVWRDIGGAARRATLVNRIRAEKGHATLVIDAGDINDGTPFSVEYHGEADIASMNAIGYDVACPGNHDFNIPFPQVLKNRDAAQFAYLCANVRLKDGGSSVFKQFVIKDVSGIKVAFFGLTTVDGATYPGAKSTVNIADPVAEAKQLVPLLRKQSDIIIAVTHIGVMEDQRLAREVPGIDVIVGGHSHTMLPDGLSAVSTPGSDLVRPTIIVQNFQWAGTLGRLDLSFQQIGSRWRINKFTEKLLPITSALKDDRKTAAVVAKYWDPIKTKYAVVLGTASDDFTERGDDFAHYNLVADVIHETMKTEFDIENVGGVRAPLVKGPITYGDMFTMDPFGNTVVTFKISGSDLKALLAKAVPAVSGIRYEVQNGLLTAATINGKPIVDNVVYVGSTNSYLASQPEMKSATEKVDTKRARLDLVMEYIRSKKTVSPSYDGRRKITIP